jgi:threonylcarbamoyladenosine tRNA methylthiotransferase MtaB
MKQQFYAANLGQEFPVLWEGYSEIQPDGKKLVFGYTPNYLRSACLVGMDESLENLTLPFKISAIREDCVFGELSGKPLLC